MIVGGVEVPEVSKRQKKRDAIARFNADFEKRRENADRVAGLAKLRALNNQLWRGNKDEKLLAKEPREITRTQLVKFRPRPEPNTPGTNSDDDRDLAAVIAADSADGAPLDFNEPDEEDVRATAERFAFRYHQRCRGRGYRVRDGKAIICKCAARKMKAYVEAEA